MQSYKTIVCFLTSWFVLFLGEPVRFSLWGIVSGLFWVPGAACGIYAIRNCGISVAVGTWSAIQVIVSCVFGIIIFQEEVKDKTQTMFAFLTLMIGLVGMSRYSDPSAGKSSSSDYSLVNTGDGNLTDDTSNRSLLGAVAPKKRKSSKKSRSEKSRSISPSKRDDPKETSVAAIALSSPSPSIALEAANTLSPLEIEDYPDVLLLDDDVKALAKDRVNLFGGRLVLTRRQLGVLGAVVNGKCFLFFILFVIRF
jgi:multidrug transporter EmrE-like cation transporter